MANYFTYFSLLIPLNDPAQQQYALELAVKAVSCRFQDGDESSAR